jgi:hypothetical protein
MPLMLVCCPLQPRYLAFDTLMLPLSSPGPMLLMPLYCPSLASVPCLWCPYVAPLQPRCHAFDALMLPLSRPGAMLLMPLCCPSLVQVPWSWYKHRSRNVNLHFVKMLICEFDVSGPLVSEKNL